MPTSGSGSVTDGLNLPPGSPKASGRVVNVAGFVDDVNDEVNLPAGGTSGSVDPERMNLPAGSPKASGRSVNVSGSVVDVNDGARLPAGRSSGSTQFERMNLPAGR